MAIDTAGQNHEAREENPYEGLFFTTWEEFFRQHGSFLPANEMEAAKRLAAALPEDKGVIALMDHLVTFAKEMSDGYDKVAS